MRIGSYPCAAILLVAALLLCGCTDRRTCERVKAASFSELLNRAGWERVAGEIPAERSIEAALLAFATTPYRWETRKQGALTQVSALPENPLLGPVWTFVVAPDAEPVLPVADAGGAFRLGLAPVAEPGPFTRLDRLHQVVQLHDGDARYRWGGCLRYEGPQPVRNLELRAVLLDRDPVGVRGVRPGNPRRATRRSGIPRTLAAGEFFCTELESGKVPKATALLGNVGALGVIEATWTDEAGARRFATLSAQALDWRDYDQVPGEPFAVLEGGTLDTGDDGPATLPNPTLVTVLSRKGRQLMVRTSDGLQGSIPLDRLNARFPNPGPELTARRHEALARFIAQAVSGGQAQALGLYDPADVAEDHDALLADLSRRYPPRPDGEELKPVIQPLSIHPVDGGEIVTVFVWLKRGHTPVWTTLDTVFFAADRLRPIHPALRVVGE